MEQTFWQKLRRVKIGDLLHIFKFLAALPIAWILKRKYRDLWLLCDTENEARDNAYWLFRYIRENHPERRVMFAINYDSPDYERVNPLGDTVMYGSFRHWVYYLTASKNISSQKMGKPNAAICYLLEIYGILKNNRVFLQHGIITANLTFLYYPHTKMRLFVCSTKQECSYVSQNYGYPRGWVQNLGLCRFDRLHDFIEDKKQILIMPTWRMYIRNELTGSKHKNQIKSFRETDYFKGWNGLLSDGRFLRLIEEKGIRAVFYPHREMFPFLDAFQISHPNIVIGKWPQYDVQELLKESAFLITDFSSVAMDFAYMKKPLVYYQFDRTKFRKHHHEAGYFDFETDGFGMVCNDVEQVITELEKGIGCGFQNDEKYLKRHENYFDLWDKNNCKRNYEAILEI